MLIVYLCTLKKGECASKKHMRDLYSNFIAYIFSNIGRDIKTRCKYIFSYKQMKRLSRDIGFKMTDSL